MRTLHLWLTRPTYLTSNRMISSVAPMGPIWVRRASEDNCRKTDRKSVLVTSRHGCLVGTTAIIWEAQETRTSSWKPSMAFTLRAAALCRIAVLQFCGCPFFWLLFFGEAKKSDSLKSEIRSRNKIRLVVSRPSVDYRRAKKLHKSPHFSCNYTMESQAQF